MSIKVGRREYFLFKVSDAGIRSFVDYIKSSVTMPNGCSLEIIPSECGIEIIMSGFNEDVIRSLDLKISSKVLEICERRSLKCHTIGPLEIISASR